MKKEKKNFDEPEKKKKNTINKNFITNINLGALKQKMEQTGIRSGNYHGRTYDHFMSPSQ